MKTLDLEKFQQTKAYDFLLGLPLIAWFGYEAIRLRPALGATARALLADPFSLLLNLRFVSLLAVIAFNLLTVYLIVMRDIPVRRSKGFLPYAAGFVGTFIGVGIGTLKPVPLPLGWQMVSTFLTCVGFIGCFIVLSKLGKSFSIMPEARKLVTGGPYALARHPLYAVEIIAIAGVAMLFEQPWALLMAAAVIVMLVVRSYFEEKILAEAFPEYAEYRTRVKRFGFI